jgi:hypothetical protein
MGRTLRVLAALVALVQLPAAAEVRLKVRTIAGPAGLHAGPLLRKSVHRSHFVVEMEHAPSPLTIMEWQRRGIRVAGHIPPSAVVVSAPDGADLRVQGMRWSGRLSAADKISALIGWDEEAAGAYLVEFYPDVDMTLARELVRESGMELQGHPDLLANQLLVLGSDDRVAGLAEWDEVAYVFPASADLLAGNHLLACAGAMSDSGLVGQYVKVSEGWSADARGVELSYVFTALTPKLPVSTVQSELARALAEWAKYAPLVFTAGDSAGAPRTIAIQFASGQHGDGYGFDGPGGVLAHTFYPAPPTIEPLAGDMHFDADEAWDNTQKVDLYSVALHEAGHALGLGHSDKPGAVMYPYYRLNASLSNDDIAGIRAIYAAPNTTPTQPLAVTVAAPAVPAITVTTSTIAISGTVSGGTGTPQVAWTSNQGSSGKASGSSVWNIAVVPLNLGMNIVTVTASDDAGNIASKVLAVTRQAATTPTTPANPPATPATPTTPTTPTSPSGSPPALKITSPGFTIVSTSAAAITVSGTASADTTAVTWSNSVGGSGTAAGTAAWSATVPLLTGTNTVTVKAFNATGSSWRSLTVVRR